MLEAAREQLFAVHLEPFAMQVLGANAHLGRARYFSMMSGKLSTFRLVYFALAGDNLGVHDHQLLIGVLAPAQVDHRYALGYANLLRGQSGSCEAYMVSNMSAAGGATPR